MKIAHATSVYAPKSIVIPNNEKGKPFFKLQAIAEANGYKHDNAHDALADVTHAIASMPASAYAYSVRAIIYSEAGRYKEAMADAIRAIATDDKYAFGYCARAEVYILTGRHSEALRDCDKAVRVAAPAEVPNAHCLRSFELSLRRQFAEALTESDQAAAAMPYSPDCYTGRGISFLGLGRPADAIKDFTKAMSLAEVPSILSLLGLSMAYQMKGDTKQSAICATKLKAPPDYRTSVSFIQEIRRAIFPTQRRHGKM